MEVVHFGLNTCESEDVGKITAEWSTFLKKAGEAWNDSSEFEKSGGAM